MSGFNLATLLTPHLDTEVLSAGESLVEGKDPFEGVKEDFTGLLTPESKGQLPTVALNHVLEQSEDEIVPDLGVTTVVEKLLGGRDIPLQIDHTGVEQLMPQSSQILAGKNLQKEFDETILSLAHLSEGELKEALSRFEELSIKSPQKVLEIISLEGEERARALANLLFAKPPGQLENLDPQTQQARMAFLAEFSGVRGKIFRERAVHATETTKAQQILLAGQEEKIAPLTASLQEQIDAHFRAASVTEQPGSSRDNVPAPKKPLEAGLKINKDTLVMAEEDPQTQVLKEGTPAPLPTAQEDAAKPPAEMATLALDSHSNGAEAKELTTPITKQVASQIHRFVTSERFNVPTMEKLNIQLQPASLGRVEVHLELLKDGSVKTIMIAEPDSLKALRQDVHALEKSFNNSGFSTKSDGFSFQEREGQGSPKFAAAPFLGDTLEENTLLDTHLLDPTSQVSPLRFDGHQVNIEA